MDNNELKIKFKDITNKIEEATKNGENVEFLLIEKVRLLQIGYKKLSEELSNEMFEKNPRKYSTLLSYLNNIMAIQKELKRPSFETEAEIAKVYQQMDKAGLGWLVKKR